MQVEVNRDNVVAIGTAEEVMEALFGPAQHDEHCKGWRWHLYVRDSDKRWAAVQAELRLMIAERRAREDQAEAA